jgi:hypothetical protein
MRRYFRGVSRESYRGKFKLEALKKGQKYKGRARESEGKALW